MTGEYGWHGSWPSLPLPQRVRRACSASNTRFCVARRGGSAAFGPWRRHVTCVSRAGSRTWFRLGRWTRFPQVRCAMAADLVGLAVWGGGILSRSRLAVAFSWATSRSVLVRSLDDFPRRGLLFRRLVPGRGTQLGASRRSRGFRSPPAAGGSPIEAPRARWRPVVSRSRRGVRASASHRSRRRPELAASTSAVA